METITIVGAGVAGLTAAITCAEAGAPVVLYDAHGEPGGRARSLDAPYKANLGPHVLYSDGALWGWLKERDLLPPSTGIPYTGLRLRWDGAIHRTPPLALIPSMLKLRGRRAPDDQSFRAWASSHAGERTAEWLSALAGVYTYHHDPGELSAAFVWERTSRLASPPPSVRFLIGGWSALVEALVGRARQLGVEFRLGERVSELPADADDRRGRAVRRPRAARRPFAALDQRPHGLHRPRAGEPPRRPVRRLGSGRVRLGGALHRRRPDVGARRAGARPGADAGPSRRVPRRHDPPPRDVAGPRLSRPRHPHRLAPPDGDARPHRRARPPRDDLARPPSARPRGRRVPRGRLGGRARVARGGRVEERGRAGALAVRAATAVPTPLRRVA